MNFLLASLLLSSRPDLQHEMLTVQAKIGGWCSQEKVKQMTELICEVRPSLCVEIGVLYGASLYPTAKTLDYLGQGIVYAIDAWDYETCLEGFIPKSYETRVWKKIDFEEAYHQFLGLLDKHHLQGVCRVLRLTSSEAVHHFDDGSIDLLHIDGNHSETQAYSDVVLFFPKVRSGGYIWMDDAHWRTTQKAVAFLKENAIFIPEKSIGDQCLLFQKPMNSN